MIWRAVLDPPALLGVDLGTQTVRAVAFDRRGRRLAAAGRPTPSVRRGEESADYDPDALFAIVEACLSEVVAALPKGVPVAGLAVASVGESCVLVDDEGRATAPALVWFDRRTEEAARAIEARIGEERLFALTGHRVDPTFGLCKMAWMREAWPDAFARAKVVLNIADWIAFRLTGLAATDFTLASRTLALDLRRRRWSSEILEALGFAPELLAPLKPNGAALGPMRRSISGALGFAEPPIVAVGGHDHLCGLFAADAARAGVLLDSMGTAEALLLATSAPLGDPSVLAQGFFQGAIGALGELFYIGGGINSSGGAIEWVRALIGGGSHEALIAEAAAVEPGGRGLIFLPHLAYAPPPEPDIHARGAFVGLSAASDRASLYRAVLEGLALQARRMIDALAAVPGVGWPSQIRVIGGNSRNDLLLSIKASALNAPLLVLDEPEATALGAALLGGLGAGLWPDLDGACAELDRPMRVIEPELGAARFYAEFYESQFLGLQTALRPIHRDFADRRPPLAPKR
ncbi:MAG TPA: FGGY family carbohydrate kinase [Roseiarcus sp.]|nr:FGGY family carbohydrate kinase [Roseiarcus sp.]